MPPFLPRALAILLLALPGAAGAQTLYNQGSPSADEQFMLELLNRARANPAAEGVRLGQSGFGGYAPRPPVAFNANLNASALAHNNDMAAHNYFSHTGSDGSTPDTRIKATGYNPGADGENIASGFPTAEATFDALMIDDGVADLGHRRNFLEFDQTGNFFREIGIASVNDGDTTQDFGYQPGVTLLCGVAYQDGDGNGFYTPGEGLGGIKVTSPGSSYYTLTSASGGYALPMDKLPANNTAPQTAVTFALPDGTTQTSTATFKPAVNASNRIAGGLYDNVKVDLVVASRPAFFTGQTALSGGVYYLALPDGNFFGYYAFFSDSHYLYHFDLGDEYVFDANDGQGGVFLYDFASQTFWYTSPADFPYLYDFTLGTFLYYYPDPSNPGHYNINGTRYFYDFATQTNITK